jgi:PAS domain S-box-containing protein
MGAMESTQQRQHWQALLDSAGEGIWGLNLEGACTFVNRMAVRVLGFTAEEMEGREMHDLVHHHYPDGRVYPTSECSITAILKGKEPFRGQLDTMFRRDGSSFLAEVSAQPVMMDGAVTGVVVTFRDVSELHRERKKLERAYTEAAKRTAELDAVIESIPHGVYVATLDGSPVRLNQRAKAMKGDPFPERLKTLDLALRGKSSNDVIEEGGRWLRSTGAPILLNGELIGGVAVNSDVTQIRLQDEALRKSEKLAAVGQLASSIAHEINNPLESITNLLYLIRQADSMGDVQEYAAMAQTELARVTEITLQTLRFHRQQSKATEVDLAELARTVMALYTGRLLVRSVTLAWKLRPAPRVWCLEGEMRQVLNNLVRNALDAMSAGGRLSIRVQPQTELGGDRKTARAGVRLTIADTGEGISPKIAERLFEPFQTTKENTGTGLGLWVSRGIVEKHGGRIRTRTSTGERHGTVFAVWLPMDGGITLTSQPTD